MHQDIQAELAFHRDMAARHDSAIPLGNAAAIEEHGYDLWRFSFLENLWRDVGYAARGLRRSPVLVLAALTSLGLGIGVNAAMFSLGVEFLFSEPSVRDAGSLVSVQLAGNSHSAAKTIDFLRSSGLFADVTGENEETIANFNDGAETRPIFSVYTAKNYFTALGVPMLHGRGIVADDPNEVAVLSYAFWRKQFGGDSSVVGRAIKLDGRMCTVVGILPEHHRTLIGFGYSPDVFLPQYLDSTILAIYARLKPGMSISAARAGLVTVTKRLDAEMPAQFKYADQVRVSPIAGFARLRAEKEMLAVGAFFAMLLAVTGLVLLIACVNVASLLLARASARRREIAIRLALGAGRGRLLQQLLADSLLLSLLGTAVGLALAEVTAALLARIQLPLPIPIRLQIEPDWRLAAYAALLTTFAALACGLLPAWQSMKESLTHNMHREGKMRLRRTLVAAQIAISVVVLTTGFLFLRNLIHSNSISPGFDVLHTLRANVNMPPAGYSDGKRKAAYIDQVVDSLAALPGIESAAAARIVPFNGGTRFMIRISFPDNRVPKDAFFFWNAVTPGYFRAMGIPLLQGRTFLSADRSEKVVIVNREFVTRYLGHRQPLGTTFLWGDDGKTPYRIVGVAEGTKTMTIGEEPQPQLYEPSDSDRQRSPGHRIRDAVGDSTRASIGPRPPHAASHRAIGWRASGHDVFEHRPGISAQPGGGAAHGLDRHSRTAAGHRGALWRDGLFGGAAHARNRRPHGDRRQPRRHRAHGARRCRARHHWWYGRRVGGGAVRDQAARHVSGTRPHAGGPAEFRRHRAGHAAHRSGGHMGPHAPRHQRRPERDPARRIKHTLLSAGRLSRR